MSLVKRTAQLSLAVQLLAGVATLTSFFVSAPQNYEYTDDLYTILGIETASQVVEFLYYFIAVVCFGGNISTWTRYIDWYISTPVMLVSTAMFFEHRKQSRILDVVDVRISPDMYIVLALNALMLSFGLVMELDVIPRVTGLALGGFSFVGSYTFLAMFVDAGDAMSLWLFYIIYGVWGLYGVAAAMPYVSKNVMYNLLDIVSKNFYGLFLFVYLMTR